ncbi:hypothetical protein L228DRAFT_243360 [Xylona heveae TC161]|uniref:Uncharacterized protein n=1 Tax=Xylona heveae (strain CBS 132557 / TC161) TaxID=1328760 RepID=A0A165JZX4_XYLHT|nr:hypothetical protein L228DRAFT_243360 [Xylona heveae TC161]KZF26832.1 hypothetical protein L228DRAFT_243360 [Xylona heveae TC161]
MTVMDEEENEEDQSDDVSPTMAPKAVMTALPNMRLEGIWESLVFGRAISTDLLHCITNMSKVICNLLGKSLAEESESGYQSQE